jgi:hypothetical protein
MNRLIHIWRRKQVFGDQSFGTSLNYDSFAVVSRWSPFKILIQSRIVADRRHVLVCGYVVRAQY